MTTMLPPMCLSRVHFHHATLLTCDAFPAGIPQAILMSEHDYRLPYDGNGGVRCTQRPVLPGSAAIMYVFDAGSSSEPR